MKDTKIISGFPAIGKSFLSLRNDIQVLDSDSSNFSWIKKGVRHPNFPSNYIKHIQENIGKVDYILVSSHEVVRNALKDNGISYTIVYPKSRLKDEYLERYKVRGNDDKFIEFIEMNWNKFIEDIHEDTFPDHIQLGDGMYLADVIHLV